MTDELISKKSLLKNLDLVISEYQAQYSWKRDGVIMSILTSVRDLVSSKPIVYDIDTVIEQLEEASVNYCREYGYAEDENILYLPDAIEIVKRGGAE